MDVGVLGGWIQAIYGQTAPATLWILGHSRDLPPSRPLRHFSLDLSSGSLKIQLRLGEAVLGEGSRGPSKEAAGKHLLCLIPKTQGQWGGMCIYTLFACRWLTRTCAGHSETSLISTLLDNIDILYWEHGKPEAFLGLWLILFSISAAPGLFWCVNRAF